ncbi:MAG: pilus assembly protein PilY, partial [Burkholderiaceae bacterium]
MKKLSRMAVLPLAIGLVASGPATAAPPFTIASYPLFLAPAVKPNLMVIFDNSQSMDATMSGQIISGNLAQTRGNVARSVLRSVITTNRDNFNWGLTAFDTSNIGLRDIFAYYLGDATTMVYTADCVAGISPSNGGRRCLPNPAGGANFLTYDRSGDDLDINDVTYVNRASNVMYGVGTGGTTYSLYDSRVNAAGTGWALSPPASDFSSFFTSATLSATDAGFVSNSTTYPRRLWLKRGWGYRSDISGSGEVRRTVQADSTVHYDSLMSLLAPETVNPSSSEIKNAASLTPLAGSLDTVRNYYRQGESSFRPSPISETCQANFVVLATDGNPTARVNG